MSFEEELHAVVDEFDVRISPQLDELADRYPTIDIPRVVLRASLHQMFESGFTLEEVLEVCEKCVKISYDEFKAPDRPMPSVN